MLFYQRKESGYIKKEEIYQKIYLLSTVIQPIIVDRDKRHHVVGRGWTDICCPSNKNRVS